MSLLKLEDLTTGIGDLMFCRQLNVELNEGQTLGVLGRNGIGKSTLLYSLLGIQGVKSGGVKIAGQDTATMSRRQLARTIGILYQESDYTMPATVLELALLGRHPHTDNLLWDNPDDLAIVSEILMLLGLSGMEKRQVASLSGGEKQRLAIALVLIQDPRLYLLDEPSNHLDVDYQLKILSLLRDRAVRRQSAVIMVSHDINLAARFCDLTLLMLEDGDWICGETTRVLNDSNLSRAFGCDFVRIDHEGRDYFLPR